MTTFMLSQHVCTCVCEWSAGVCDLICVYPCASLPVHVIFLEKHEGSVCNDTLSFLRGGFASCRFTAYLSFGHNQENANVGNQRKSGWS